MFLLFSAYVQNQKNPDKTRHSTSLLYFFRRTQCMQTLGATSLEQDILLLTLCWVLSESTDSREVALPPGKSTCRKGEG